MPVPQFYPAIQDGCFDYDRWTSAMVLLFPIRWWLDLLIWRPATPVHGRRVSPWENAMLRPERAQDSQGVLVKSGYMKCTKLAN